MNIEQTLETIKTAFDQAITTARFNDNEYNNGHRAKEALIRSQKLINYIHEFIKEEFIRNGVNKNKIYPPLGATKPELKIKGFLKAKNQDILIVPDSVLIEKISGHFPEVEKVLTINVRSQLSSLNKNIDTLYERTFAEALNLHLSYPKQCLGEVYLIPTHEYDDRAMLNNRVEFKRTASKIEDYIKMFQAINVRKSVKRDEYKYERICLLIADFGKESPKLYSSIQDLINDGIVPENTEATLENLTIYGFVETLLDIYSHRFGENVLT